MPQTNVKHWRRLDNAAKLFPAASSKRDTRVFRFYCELKEDIQQEILQIRDLRGLAAHPRLSRAAGAACRLFTLKAKHFLFHL